MCHSKNSGKIEQTSICSETVHLNICVTLVYRFDLDCCITLTMTMLALVVFAPLEFEDNDLWPAAIFDDSARDKRSIKSWRADANAIVIARSENISELDRIASVLTFQRGDAHDITWTHAELFPACADDCICHSCGSSNDP